MKQLVVLVVILHIVCNTMLVKANPTPNDEWQDECDRERQRGNTCELSKWICVGTYEQQTMKIITKYGSSSKMRARSPCTTEVTWEQECNRERQRGNKCELSKWICVGTYEQQTMKIITKYGSSSKTRSRSPCTTAAITWEEECNRERELGNKCELSEWFCDKKLKLEKQTMKITKKDGSWSSKWRTRIPKKPCSGGSKTDNCPKENGYCLNPKGQDQQTGRKKLDAIDRNTPELQASCLAKCRTVAEATGCLAIWNRWNRGCYVYTSAVAKGSGSDDHACWVFSKCKGLRCHGQDNGCCTEDTPCDIGDGDCDSDQECTGSLVCGDDNCPWGDHDDCCRKGGCVDVKIKSSCDYWKELGYCTKGVYVHFMKENCCQTCKV